MPINDEEEQGEDDLHDDGNTGTTGLVNPGTYGQTNDGSYLIQIGGNIYRVTPSLGGFGGFGQGFGQGFVGSQTFTGTTRTEISCVNGVCTKTVTQF